jgi:hypothetical protein
LRIADANPQETISAGVGFIPRRSTRSSRTSGCGVPDGPPAAGVARYLAQKRAIESALASLKEHAANQAIGRRLQHAEVTKERARCKALREEHLAPIAPIARATLADAPGIERAEDAALGIGPLKLVAEVARNRNEHEEGTHRRVRPTQEVSNPAADPWRSIGLAIESGEDEPRYR